MTSKTFLTCLSIVLFSNLFLNCGKKKVNDNAEQSNYSELNENVLVVSSDTSNSSLIAIDSNSLTFNALGSGVAKIKNGDILVSDITDKAPFGYLRKVTAITYIGSQKVCLTVNSSLEEALKNCHVKFEQPISPGDIQLLDSSGVDMSQFKKSRSFTIEKPFSKWLGITVSGDVKINPTFLFELDINNYSISKLRVATLLENFNILEVEAIASFSGNRDTVLASYALKPKTIWIGNFPLVLQPYLILYVGISGTVTAKISASVSQSNTVLLGFEYTNGTWNQIYQTDHNLTFQKPTFEGEVSVEPYIGFKYQVHPYGIKKVKADVALKNGLEVKTNTNCELNFNWKSYLNFNFHMDETIFNDEVDYIAPLYSDIQHIGTYQSNNCGYHVGDTALGGIIFYLDPLSSFPNQHGLVCCYPNQISLVASMCFPGPCITPNLGPCPFPYSTDTLIGTGHINTNFIVNKISSGLGSYAALICDNYTFGGYTDWFLPSIDELKELYYAKDSIPTLPLLDYWSSSITYNSSNWPNSDLLVVSSFDLQTGNYGMGATGSGGFSGNGYSLPCFNGFCVPIRKF